jgi:hypothetical protein
LREGAKVEARYRGKTRYYPGRISRDRGDGTYDIDYDDGEKEQRVMAELIKPLELDLSGGRGAGVVGGGLREGSRVEARYRGKTRHYPGRISRDRGDGTYDIDYDDGEKEQRVMAELIRSLEAGGVESPRAITSPRRMILQGMRVKANFKGKGQWFQGKISSENHDGTFDILFDDGDRDMGVTEANIMTEDEIRAGGVPGGGASAGGRGGGGGGGGFREMDKVEAQYRGKTRFYPGIISRDRRDGTYDIDYDDGEKEQRVAEQLIRKR